MVLYILVGVYVSMLIGAFAAGLLFIVAALTQPDAREIGRVKICCAGLLIDAFAALLWPVLFCIILWGLFEK